MHPQNEESDWEAPFDESPVEVPSGWSGGLVWHTGGNIWMRSWYNTPDGRPVADDENAPEEYLTVGYNDSFNGVSVSRYEMDDEGRYYHAEVVEDQSMPDADDEELAEAARDLMLAFND